MSSLYIFRITKSFFQFNGVFFSVPYSLAISSCACNTGTDAYGAVVCEVANKPCLDMIIYIFWFDELFVLCWIFMSSIGSYVK